jgi:tetratricopeptide (TPR) repeat protein
MKRLGISDVGPVALALTLLAGCDRAPAPAAAPVPAPAPAAADGAAETPPADPAPRAPVALRSELGRFFQLVDQRRTGAARVQLRKHLNLHPDDGQAEFLFGLSYHREKRYALARPYFEAALAHAPDYDTTQYFLGWALYYLGEPDAARAAFDAHLALRPDEADTHFALGLIDLDADRLDDAERRFRRSLELLGDDPERPKEISKAHARLADVHMRRGAYEAARADLIIATALFDDHYEAYYKLFRVHMRLGDTEAAEAAQQRFLAARQRVHPRTSFPE